MKWFYDFKTMTKLMLGFGLVSIITGVTGWMGLANMGTINANVENVYQVQLLPCLELTTMRGLTHQLRTNVFAALTTTDATEVKAFVEEGHKLEKQLHDCQESFLPTIRAEEVRTAFTKYQQVAKEYLVFREEQVFKPLLAGQHDAAQLAAKQGAVKFEAAIRGINETIEVKTGIARKKFEESQAIYASSRTLMLQLVGGGLLLGLGLGYAIARLIAQPLTQAVSVLQAVADGDFSKRLEVDSRDEVGQMATALNQANEAIGGAMGQAIQVMEATANGDFTRRITIATKGEVARMTAALNQANDLIGKALAEAVHVLEAMAAGDFTLQLQVETKGEVARMAAALNTASAGITRALQEVRSVADTVAGSSQQLSSASEEISSGAQEQAASLEETASSLEEITATIKQNADNAQQARQLAETARDVAGRGGQVVASAVSAMGEINQASKKIADIITAIDEIAFQTNLLALNAAVEAARAGEQGRGFAVVAAEVRNLAQRSASAAKEIKGLIQDSVRKVDTGCELVNQSGQSLKEIVASVGRVSDIIAEIAAASKEQAAGIEQVNKAVTQMDSVIQGNAAQTEELSGTAQGLAAQAEQLQALVARFRLEQDTARPEIRSVPPVLPSTKAGLSSPAGKRLNGKAIEKAAAAATASVEGNGAEPVIALVGVAGAELEGGFQEF